ncbi:hypothetical protein MNBD_GAMMA25-861 [hydrothermal vent metagenome]|uniref:DUF4412 domain-containing protein n=1 Tax=hydrothermal vent metagenome TaxID=652676 RepID=A0A3B1B9H6_9ZZZZ
MILYRLINLFLGLCLLSASVSAAEQKGTVLLFSEYEKDVKPYQTRVIITDRYMRFDDGEGAIDFILFDRKDNIIFNISSDEQTIMSVSPQTLKVVPPFALQQDVQKQDSMNDAPKIVGIKPQHYVFSTNQQHCYDVVAVDGLLNDALEATRAFNAILASQNATTLQFLPADQQNPCELSRNIFSYNRYLQFGFPVQEWDNNGKGRALMDFKENIVLDKNLFVLPEGYKRFSVKKFREGQVNFNE